MAMNNKELYHSGIVGMKWGIRKYQNKDGTLTEAGKKRYRSRYIKDDLGDGWTSYSTRDFKKTVIIEKKNSKQIHDDAVTYVNMLMAQNQKVSIKEMENRIKKMSKEEKDYYNEIIEKAEDQFIDYLF